MVRVLSWCGFLVAWVSRGVGPLVVWVSRPAVRAKFPSTIIHRNLTPRCARKCGPGGPHYVQTHYVQSRTTFRRTAFTSPTIRQPHRPATTIPHLFPLRVFASLRETLSAQVSKHRNSTPRCARLRGPGGPHYVQSCTTFRRTAFRRTAFRTAPPIGRPTLTSPTRRRTMFSIDI